MTVEVTSAFSGPFVPNGVTTVFPYTFHALTAAEVRVEIDGADVSSADYTVNLNSDFEGGNVTFASAPTGDVLYIASNPNFDQEVQFENAGAFLPESHDEANDRAAVRSIYLKGMLDRAILAPLGDLFTTLLPSAADRALKFLTFDGEGNPAATESAMITTASGATVSTRTGVALIADPQDGQSVLLSEMGYEGTFIWRDGDFTNNVTGDPNHMFFIPSAAIDPSEGAWVRVVRDQPEPLGVPAGFDWYPPVQVYRSLDGIYTTNFNAELWKVPDTTASLYISPTGNDATGDGSEANPWRNIYKVMPEAALLPDENINIFIVGGGEYVSNGSCDFPDKNVNMICTGGQALITNKVPRGAWTLDGAGTYKASLSGYNVGRGVRDWKFPTTWDGGEQSPQWLTLAASKAACQATPGTYWTDGVDVWVHRQDGSVVSDATGADVGVIHQNNNALITHADRQYYIENVDFEGGQLLCQPSTMTTIDRVVLNNTHLYGASFLFYNTNLAILNGCQVFESQEGDLFAYTPRAPGEPPTNAIEIDCRAYRNRTAGPNDNASTNHEDGKTMRVNCIYRDTMGPVCADVGSTHNWNLNVDAQDSLLTSSDENDASFVCGNSASVAARTWLDGCTFGGSFYDVYVGPGCILYYRNMGAPASVGGAGTVTTY